MVISVSNPISKMKHSAETDTVFFCCQEGITAIMMFYYELRIVDMSVKIANFLPEPFN